ncbi:MAG: histone H2A.Z [Watsoniomyces obsoletus]|nr:MAG: histone H2A.Z [Watsoniomyces obsoletus]
MNGPDTVNPALVVSQQLDHPVDLMMTDTAAIRDRNGALGGGDGNEDLRELPVVPMPRGESPEVQEHYFPPLEKPTIDALPMASLRTGLCYDTRMGEHYSLLEDDDHPEDPQRIEAIHSTLHRAGLVADEHGMFPDRRDVLHRIVARFAKVSEVKLVHTTEHFQFMRETRDFNRETLLQISREGDSVYFNQNSYVCGRLAAGGAIECCKAVILGDVKNAIAVIRPPGHHATPSEAQGFCIFNNVSIAAKTCQLRYASQCRKVLIFDWDVHHGNGTQDTFYEDPNTLYISVHVHMDGKFYPNKPTANHEHCGEGKGIGKNVNIPWTNNGMGDADYMYAFQKVVMPIAAEFDPDLVIISAGFDAAEGDSIGGCYVTPACYAHMTHALMGLARGKVVVCLEGGYNLDSISECALAVTKTLLGEPPDRLKGHPPSQLAIHDVNMVMKRQARYWSCLSDFRQGPDITGGEGTPLNDVIRMYRRQTLEQELGMINLAVLREGLAQPFKDQIMATPNFSDCKVLLFILHDPPELRGAPNPANNVLADNESWVMDTVKSYIRSASKMGFGVVDVNVPKHLEGLEKVPADDEDAPNIKAVKDLVLYMWDNYLEPYDAQQIFLMGVGHAYHGMIHLLNSRNCRSRVSGVINFVYDLSLLGLRRELDPEYINWYYKNSQIYVEEEHPIFNIDGKPIRRRNGKVLPSTEKSLVGTVEHYQREVFVWITRRAPIDDHTLNG